MKAVVLTKHGGPENFEVREIAKPTIKSNEVLINVKAFALNHLDLWVRKGWPDSTLPFPHVGGTDLAGIVEEIGKEVTNVNVGDRVLVNPGISCLNCEQCRNGEQSQCEVFGILGSSIWGGAAEFAVVPSVNVLQIPDNMEFKVAAAAPLVSLTVYRMMVTKAKIKAGDWVLVLGGGGGIGTTAIQMGKHFGGNVIALTSTSKIDAIDQLGADFVIDYQTTTNWYQEVMNITNGYGVDIIIDPVGQATWIQSIKSLATGGRMVVCGATTGPTGETQIRTLFSKQGSIMGTYMGNIRDFKRSMKLVFEENIKPVIYRVLNYNQLAEAHKILEDGNHIGKIVLTFDST